MLSGGERQIVTIARALAQEPRTLVLDEPTSHLDLGSQSRLASILRQVRAERSGGRTVVFSTHDPNAAAAIADHIVLLKRGQVLAAGNGDRALTAAHLSDPYGVPIEVVETRGRRVIVTV